VLFRSKVIVWFHLKAVPISQQISVTYTTAAQDKVAAAFQSVIQAETKKGEIVNNAQREAQSALIYAAGNVSRALVLDGAIIKRNNLREQDPPDAKAIAAADQTVNDYLLGNSAKGVPPASGAVAKAIASARANASRDISEAAKKARLFGTQVAAYQAAPELYKRRKWLEAYQALGFVRRYLLTGDPTSYDIVYETRQEAALDKVLSEGVEEERGR